MDERLLKAMVAAGAIKNINIIASGARFHVVLPGSAQGAPPFTA